MKPEITLVYDADCPNADAARAALGQALVRSRLKPEWIEVDRAAPGVAKQLFRFGSPTILVDGEDVAGESDAAAAACCRIYQTDRGLRGIPPIEAIGTAIDRAPAAKNVGGDLISKATASGALGLAFASSLSFLCCLPIFSRRDWSGRSRRRCRPVVAGTLGGKPGSLDRCGRASDAGARRLEVQSLRRSKPCPKTVDFRKRRRLRDAGASHSPVVERGDRVSPHPLARPADKKKRGQKVNTARLPILEDSEVNHG